MKLIRGIDLPGRLLLSWFTFGAMATGGALVAYGLFTERITHFMLFYTVVGLYVLGGIAGILAGGMLGMMGRPLQMRMKAALHDQFIGLLYTLPIGGMAFVFAGWMALTYWTVLTLNLVALGFVSVAWLIFAVVTALALEYGWFGLHNVSRRFKKLLALRVRLEFKE